MTSSAQPPTQLTLLAHDIGLVQSMIGSSQTLLDRVSDLSDLPKQDHAVVLADLFYRVIDCAQGLLNVLAGVNGVPAAVLARAIIEASVNLKYLQTLPNPQQGALVLRAHSLIKWTESHPEDVEGAPEWAALLVRMPVNEVEKAREMARGTLGWTGKTVKDLCIAVGFKPYSAYKYLSIEAHGGIVGRHATTHAIGEEGHFSLGSPLSSLEVESAANLARRLLWDTFKIAWSGWGEAPCRLKTSDPNLWLGKDL